jgi:hypothetical protein
MISYFFLKHFVVSLWGEQQVVLMMLVFLQEKALIALKNQMQKASAASKNSMLQHKQVEENTVVASTHVYRSKETFAPWMAQELQLKHLCEATQSMMQVRT